jgi:hypothetical protein
MTLRPATVVDEDRKGDKGKPKHSSRKKRGQGGKGRKQ